MNEQTMPVAGPFTRSRMSTQTMMLFVVISLMPALGYGIYHFGMQAACQPGSPARAEIPQVRADDPGLKRIDALLVNSG